MTKNLPTAKPPGTITAKQTGQLARVTWPTVLSTLGFVSLSGLFFFGCSQPEENKTKKIDPVLREDAEKFRNLLDLVIEARGKRSYIDLFSKTALFARVFEGLELMPSHQRKIEASINRGGNINAIATKIYESLDQQKGTYEFVRIEESDGEQTLIYRLNVLAKPEIEYHRYHLTRTPRGNVRAFDLYSYLQDESLVKQLRRQVIKSLHEENELDLDSQKDFASELKAEPTKSAPYQKLAEIIIEQDWSRAMEFWQNMPPEIRDSKIVQLQRLLVAERLDMNQYDSVLAELRTAFPTDILKEFNSIRYYRSQKAYSKLIEAVDRISERVRDPYLQHLKLDALIKEARYEQANKIIEEFKAQGWLPRLILIHQLELAVAQKDFASAVGLLKEMKEKHGLQIENAASLPQYTELIKSPEYKEWKKSLDD